MNAPPISFGSSSQPSLGTTSTKHTCAGFMIDVPPDKCGGDSSHAWLVVAGVHLCLGPQSLGLLRWTEEQTMTEEQDKDELRFRHYLERKNLASLMNDTKWRELIAAIQSIDGYPPRFRV